MLCFELNVVCISALSILDCLSGSHLRVFCFFVFLPIKLDTDENVNKDILHVLYNTLLKISAEIK